MLSSHFKPPGAQTLSPSQRLKPKPASSRPQPRSSRLSCSALNIDRRRHMDLAWQRQEQQERMLSQISPSTLGAVQDVSNLAHLERILEVSGGSVCVLAFYSRSCGICKDVMADFRELWQECRRSKARVVFLTHNVHDEFDYVSDVSRFYNVRSVPRFLFLVDGAVVRQVGMTDARQALGSRQAVRSRLEEERRTLRRILTELVFTHTPSARR